MNTSVRKHALEKIAVSTAAVGGVSGAALGAALGSALRYSQEPGEEQSILTNPIMLGALGAGIGSLGGYAVDTAPTYQQTTTFDDRLTEGLKSTIGRPTKSLVSNSSVPGPTTAGLLLTSGGLYGVGALAGRDASNEIINEVERRLASFKGNKGKALKVLKEKNLKLYNKYIKALVATGRLETDIINNKGLEGGAKRLGLLDSDKTGKLTAFLRRMRFFNPARAFTLGLKDALQMSVAKNSWLRAPKARFKAFNALPGRKAKIKVGLKGAGKAAPVIAALTGLGILGKKIFVDD
jgi:hypothetical protein